MTNDEIEMSVNACRKHLRHGECKECGMRNAYESDEIHYSIHYRLEAPPAAEFPVTSRQRYASQRRHARQRQNARASNGIHQRRSHQGN